MRPYYSSSHAAKRSRSRLSLLAGCRDNHLTGGLGPAFAQNRQCRSIGAGSVVRVRCGGCGSLDCPRRGTVTEIPHIPHMLALDPLPSNLTVSGARPDVGEADAFAAGVLSTMEGYARPTVTTPLSKLAGEGRSPPLIYPVVSVNL